MSFNCIKATGSLGTEPLNLPGHLQWPPPSSLSPAERVHRPRPRQCGPVLAGVTQPGAPASDFHGCPPGPAHCPPPPLPWTELSLTRPRATVSGTHSRGRDESHVRTRARKDARCQEETGSSPRGTETRAHGSASTRRPRGPRSSRVATASESGRLHQRHRPSRPHGRRARGPQGSETTPAWKDVWGLGSLGCRHR